MRGNSIKSLLKIPGFKVTKIESREKELHFWVEAYKRNKGVCSGCGKSHLSGYHSSKRMVAEDARTCGRRVFLHILKRRFYCPMQDRIMTEAIEWIEKGARATKIFCKEVYRLTAITTNQEAGWYLSLDDEKIYRMDRACLNRLAKEKLEPPPAGANLSVDEVSYRKYHRYLTNVIDTDRKLVIWNQKGRKAEVLDQYYEGIGEENCQKIESVALDGARTYIASTNKHAVNALVVYDRFHATQKINQVLDRVRKDELQKARKEENQELVQLTHCRQRFMLLKNKKNLTDKQEVTLKKLCELNEPIYQALLLKESFLSIYACENEQQAQEQLLAWLDQAFSSSLAPFHRLAESMAHKAQLILNWFKKRISSAISEGFNNKIKRLKRMAYGYRDIEYFKLKIHQHCGLLNPKLAT